ncbi:MAG: MFS transporter [Bacillota bacterium]|nr:MFS transporter [Bacillota bacterium]
MKEKTEFSGWRVAAGAFMIMFMTLGALQTIAIFMPPIIKDTGFSAKSIMLMPTFATLSGFVSNMLFGKFVKKLGLKWTIFTGVALLSLHYLVIAMTSSLTILLIGTVVGGFCFGFATVAPCSILVSNWFVEKRATVTSIVFAGSMIGGAILTPVCGSIIQNFGWRTAYIVLAISIMVVCLLALFLIIESPSEKGQKALGYDKAATAKKEGRSGSSSKSSQASQVLKSPGLYVILIGVFFIGLATNSESYLGMFWQEKGMRIDTSSNLLGLYSLFAAGATLILGRVTDKFGGKMYLLIFTVMMAVGLGLMTFTGVRSMIPLVIGLACFSFGGRRTANVIAPIILQDSFNSEEYKLIAGYGAAATQLGMAASGPAVGILYDIRSAYEPAFYILIGVGVIAALLIRVGMLKVAAEQARRAY